ncbi:efflux RND transporter periplasmic adaptor subunit [bacterium]|nr:efflux RND transporter periplasmic adaptor subunit [bacterium]
MRVARRLFSWKVLVLAMALGGIITGTKVVSMIYEPRGVDALRQELELAQKQRADLGLRIEGLREKLGSGGVGQDVVRTNVTVQTLSLRPIRDVLTLPGVSEAQEDILLAARNDGPVERITVEEGHLVTAGQEIARIDAEVLVQTLRSAEASENLAELSYSRIKELAGSKVASQGELDRSLSEMQQARAAVAIGRQNLRDATLVSPIDGKVDEVFLDVGEFVNRGETVARLVDADSVNVVLNVPEKDIPYLRTGTQAFVHNPGPWGGVTTGTITRIGLVADEQSKTFPVEVTVDNRDGLFRPGMINKVDVVRQSRDAAVIISVFSIMQTEKGPVVYVEEEGQARMRPIEVGIRRGADLEVTRGLNAGDRLIVVGQRTLSDGSGVQVVAERGGSAPIDFRATPRSEDEVR